MLSRVTIDRRRIEGAQKAREPQPDKEHLNNFGVPSTGYWETVVKLFLKTTAKVILIMPFLMNSVGVVLFAVIVLLVGTLGLLKTQILLTTSKREGYYNYGLLMRKAFRTKVFIFVTLVECLSYLIEYGFIIIQVLLFFNEDHSDPSSY